jgi:RimJ/RimL family protein N-acetyltransferase
MTPNVTRDLPEGWQNISEVNNVENWVRDRKDESYFYTILKKEHERVIGLLFLYSENEKNEHVDLRLGYLLIESVWGKGIGSELIGGLVNWCKTESIVRSISGGVGENNIGSIKVLEKNGFTKTNEKLKGDTLLYRFEFKE